MMDQQPSTNTPPPAAEPDEEVNTPAKDAPRLKHEAEGFSDTDSPGPIDAFGDLSEGEF
jgi:hypothetical protein